MSQFLKMEIKGIAKDAHEKFPIKFDYSAGGVAYFNGCRVEATEKLPNGQEITKRMDIQAFRDVAEELASVSDGSEIHVKGSFGQRKGKDDKYYDVVTVDEIISIG